MNAYTIVSLRLASPLASLAVQLQSSSHYVVGGFLQLGACRIDDGTTCRSEYVADELTSGCGFDDNVVDSAAFHLAHYLSLEIVAHSIAVRVSKKRPLLT